MASLEDYDEFGNYIGADLDSDDDAPEKRMIRLSFRKGGDKPFYSVLRRCLLGKAWEVRKFLAP